MSLNKEYNLALVMPVYNEQDCIADVVRDWHSMLSDLDIQFAMIILNDGSRDNTEQALASVASLPGVKVINKQNSGHGPTILTGYNEAVKLAQWVFQTDSDNEMPPEGFSMLWQERDNYDALFGYREGRQQNAGRKFISMCSRLTVKILFGSGVKDVNTPYRLMKSVYLEEIIQQIPEDTFAPNVIISGSLAKAKLKIFNCPVPHQHRQTGVVSIMRWKLWKSTLKSFFQTLKCRPKIRASK